VWRHNEKLEKYLSTPQAAKGQKAAGWLVASAESELIELGDSSFVAGGVATTHARGLQAKFLP
jgi:hypothetical protein